MLEKKADLAERKAQRLAIVKSIVATLLVLALAITLLCTVVKWSRAENAKDVLLEDAKILLVANELNLETKEVMVSSDVSINYDRYSTIKGDYKVIFSDSKTHPKLKSILPVTPELK
jgi:hypothetical protein